MSDGIISTEVNDAPQGSDEPELNQGRAVKSAVVKQDTTFDFRATFEMVIVLGMAFGIPIANSLQRFSLAWPSTQWSTFGLIRMVLHENFALLCVAFVFVRHRWQLSDLALQKPEKPIRRGMGLYLADRITIFVIFFSSFLYYFVLLGNDVPARVGDGNASVHIAARLLLVLVNPFYEEIIVVGYIFAAMRKAGFSDNNASVVSIVIRMSYHLYQGVAAFVFILPMSLLFTYAFRKWGNIWPLIIAHMLLNARSWLDIPYFSAF